jgi:mycothiol synthase
MNGHDNVAEPRLRLRPLRVPYDYPGITVANQAARTSAGRPSGITVADITRYLEHLVNCDRDRDIVVAELDDRIVGYALVFWRDLVDGDRILISHCILAPDARDRGGWETLFGWVDGRIDAIGASLEGAPAAYALTFTWGDNEIAAASLDATGWTETARGYEMLRPTLDDVPVRQLPAGFEIRPVAQADTSRVWDALVDGFRDHRSKPEATDEDRARFLDNPVHDPALWVMAFDGEEIAGGVVNVVDDEENGETGTGRGYVDAVFTRPAWRRRGLARALVAESLVRLRERGMTSALLGVDGENPNQAMTLYEDLGFEIAAVEREWRRPVTAKEVPG